MEKRMKLARILGGLAAVLLVGAVPALADSYALDPVHSFATFRIKHMQVSWSYGRINAPEGTVEYDAAAPEKTSFNLTLKTANIDTGVAARDGHLKSPSFFNAKEFPTITFVSKSAKKIDDTTLEVTGDLTIHGVTKSVTAKVELSGTGKDMKGNPLVGFETTLEIKRSDYGMTELIPAAGDEVRIIFALEAGKK
jgi:polyisoprenoid-binding protein YceI